MTNPVDLRLYALVDPERSGGHALPDLAARVVKGGATLVQLRDKVGSTLEMVKSARAIGAALAGTAVPLLINDRIDVALAAGAQGVHIGWDDMPVEDARRLLGPRAIIGLSISTEERARKAPLALLDYVAVGGVFATTSKEVKTPPKGVAGARALADIIRARAPKMPIGAIAGIDESNAGSLIAAGFDGVAIISALSMNKDPEAAARRLRSVVDEAARVPA